MQNTIELAVEFIRRAAFVDANALLKDECGVEYKKPSQCSITHCSRTMRTQGH